MDGELPIDRWVQLMHLKHTSRDPKVRADAQRERLDMEITATRLAYERRPSPPMPSA